MDTLARLEKEAANIASGMVWDGEDPAEVKEMMGRYADAASQLSGDYYQNVRDVWARYSGYEMADFTPASIDADRAVWQIEGGFSNTDYNGLTYTQVKNGQAKSGATLDDLWPSFGTDEMAAYRYAAEIVRVAARLTTQRSAAIDPTHPKYARVPSGSYTCAFCVMCASRGFAYWNEETAGKYKPFHKDDDCRIIPMWGAAKLNHYDQNHYLSMYEAAKTRAASSSANDICAEMRRLYPNQLTDGVFKDSDKFTKDNSLRYGLWRASRSQAMRAHTALRQPTDLLPPATPAEAPKWPSELPVMRAKEWNHILYGYKGGGHLHGYGWRHEADEFPESWDAEKIRQAGIEVLRMPGNMEHINELLDAGHRKGSVEGTIEGIRIRVAFSKAGKQPARITSMFPVVKGA